MMVVGELLALEIPETKVLGCLSASRHDYLWGSKFCALSKEPDYQFDKEVLSHS